MIDIHPSGKPPIILAWVDKSPQILGQLKETGDFIEYLQASEAISEVVGSGLFELESCSSFEFSTSAASMNELRDYLLESWSDAVISPEIEAAADSIYNRNYGMKDSEFRLEIKETILIQSLKKSAY